MKDRVLEIAVAVIIVLAITIYLINRAHSGYITAVRQVSAMQAQFDSESRQIGATSEGDLARAVAQCSTATPSHAQLEDMPCVVLADSLATVAHGLGTAGPRLSLL